MEEEVKEVPQTDETIAAVMALADREEEIEHLRRMFVFTIGVSFGLLLALHLILRRDL